MAPTVKFNLTDLMRKHHVTIKQLSERTGITMKRIRAIRARDSVAYTTLCDLTQAITGENVFSRARYDAIVKQVG